MPQVHCPARPIPPAPAHSTLPCIHPLSLCPSCLLQHITGVSAHMAAEWDTRGLLQGRFPFWCIVTCSPHPGAVCSMPWGTGSLPTSMPRTVVGGPHLVQLPPCQGWGVSAAAAGHPHTREGAWGFLPCSGVRRPLGSPVWCWCQMVVKQGAITSSVVSFYHSIHPDFSTASWNLRASNAQATTAVWKSIGMQLK